MQLIDRASKELILGDLSTVHYDKLLLANEHAQRPLDSNLGNIYQLSSPADYLDVQKAAASAKDIVIVGSTIAANEALSSLVEAYGDKKHVSMISDETVPLEKTLGKDIGNAILT